jgi:hypothetical protein
MSEGVNPASEIKAKMRAARVAALASLTPVEAAQRIADDAAERAGATPGARRARRKPCS